MCIATGVNWCMTYIIWSVVDVHVDHLPFDVNLAFVSHFCEWKNKKETLSKSRNVELVLAGRFAEKKSV